LKCSDLRTHFCNAWFAAKCALFCHSIVATGVIAAAACPELTAHSALRGLLVLLLPPLLLLLLVCVCIDMLR
jgi:hypothetical protein